MTSLTIAARKSFIRIGGGGGRDGRKDKAAFSPKKKLNITIHFSFYGN